MPNVMSLPNLGDPNLGNNKKKSGGGVDSSMITRMKREQAIISEQRTEPRRFGASVAITDISGGGAAALVYSFASPGYIPFVRGEQVGVTGNTASIVVSSPTTSIASITCTITSCGSGGAVTFVLPTIGTLRNGLRISLTGTFGGSGLSATQYTISALSGTSAILTTNAGAAIITNATDFSAAPLTATVVGFACLTTLTYASTGSAPVFVVGDLINVSNHTTTAHNGNSLQVTACNDTSVQYQINSFTSTTTSSNVVTITPVSSRYNGNFAITECTATSVTMALPEGQGPSILGIFTNGRNTGTIGGNRPIGQVFQPIVDKPMTRGFTDGPVMPFFRPSASLGFYRVL